MHAKKHLQSSVDRLPISPHTQSISLLTQATPSSFSALSTSISSPLFEDESLALSFESPIYDFDDHRFSDVVGPGDLDSVADWSPRFTDEFAILQSAKSPSLEFAGPASLSTPVSPIPATSTLRRKSRVDAAIDQGQPVKLSTSLSQKRRLSKSTFSLELSSHADCFASSLPNCAISTTSPTAADCLGQFSDLTSTSKPPPYAKRVCGGPKSTFRQNPSLPKTPLSPSSGENSWIPLSDKPLLSIEESPLRQTATPPPSARKGRRKADEDLATMQSDQHFGAADFSNGAQSEFSSFFQSSNDVNGFPMSAPVGGGLVLWDDTLSLSTMEIDRIAEDVQLFASEHLSGVNDSLGAVGQMSPENQAFLQFQQQVNQPTQMQLNSDFLTNMEFPSPAAGLGQSSQNTNNMFNSHGAATEQMLWLPVPIGSPQQLQNRAQGAPSSSTKRERPLAAKPPRIDTSGIMGIDGLSPGFSPPLTGDSFSIPLHSPAVDPGLIYTQPPAPTMTSLGYAAPTLGTSAPSPLIADLSLPAGGRFGKGSLKHLGAAALSRSSSLKENKSSVKARPGLQRSLSDARVKRNGGRPGALPNIVSARSQSPSLAGPVSARPIAQPRSISGRSSPVKTQRLAQLTSIPESANRNIPRSRPSSPSVKFVIDSQGRAHAEMLSGSLHGAPRRLASSEMDGRSRSYSPGEYDGSSSDDEPIVIPGRSNTSFVLPDPYKPVGSFFSTHSLKRSPSERSSSTHRSPERDSPAIDSDMERSNSKSQRVRLASDDGDAMSELIRIREHRRRKSNERTAAAAASVLSWSFNPSGLGSGCTSVANSPPTSVVPTPVPKKATLTFNVKASLANANASAKANAGGGISLLTAGLQMQQQTSGPVGHAQTAVLADRSVIRNVAPMDNTIRCICGKNSPEGLHAKAVMLMCNTCKYWLHGKCLKITNKAKPPVYTCPICIGPTTIGPSSAPAMMHKASLKAAKMAAKASASPLMAPVGFQQTPSSLKQKHQIPVATSLMAPGQESGIEAGLKL